MIGCDVVCSVSCNFAQMLGAVTSATSLSFVIGFFAKGGGCS